ncbi:apolipoprotein N-acyltransferase [Permianibacter aggregans]|uniref:Apolipoprotein N-acyltransferase n=1 Tax=Permianibacter aggregans TaxID=1510150 RepID=A0A4R6UPS2_9GAMM|nr:apolipoprotein N-acyltransferase [Permianibacter aggregans]QGX39130.1 apolipoprotein N-acyltransferase [Permianibacter aggregans]TDQ47659.1 apolipoprotein N-acyltransferase [Permianibacter aggregans]
MYVTIRALLALLAGALYPLAFAPIDLTGMVVVSLCGLLLLWEGRSAREAAWLGWLWGVAAFGIGTSWVHVAIHVYGNAPLWLSMLLTVGFVAILALYPALLGWCLQRFFTDRRAQRLAIIPLWVIGEYLRGHLFSGFPWMFAGYSQTDTVLKFIAPIAGVYGISLLLISLAVLAIMAGHEFVRERHPLWKTATFAMLFVALALPWWRWNTPVVTDQEDSVSVALVQANIEQSVRWQPERFEQTKNEYLALTEPLIGRADLVIWPEGAIPSFANYLNDYFQPLHDRALDNNTSLIFGMAVIDPDQRYYNSVIGMGHGRGRYDKRQLVPFGEYVPFEKLLRGLLAFFNLPMSGFTEGREASLLYTPKAAIAAAICYEIAYPELVRDNVASMQQQKGFLLTVSNDAWFGRSLGPAQHLQIARMRALENELALVRSTITGITAVTDQFGQIQSQLPPFDVGVLKTRVSLHTSSSLWQRFGLWPVAIICLLLLGVAGAVNRLKNHSKTPE